MQNSLFFIYLKSSSNRQEYLKTAISWISNEKIDSKKIEEEISELMQDENITKKEKYLSVRAFTYKQKREAYEKQNGICTKCKQNFELNEMEADYITPLAWMMKNNSWKLSDVM